MKNLLLFSLVLFLSTVAYSQTVIENPKTGMSTSSYLKLEKVEISDSATILYFHIQFRPNNWISIPKQTYIQPIGSEEKLFATGTIDIPLGEKYTIPESGEKSYAVIFPKIDPTTKKIDYGEGNDGGTWFIYDIQLKPELFQSMLPAKISGNWFRSNNAQWQVSLFDSLAVYKNQIWKYANYSEKKGISKIELKKGSKILTIYAKAVNDSICMIGQAPGAMVKCTDKVDESVLPKDTKAFEPPLYKMDTVIYRGLIRNFSPRFKQRTGTVYVNDALIGDQVSYLMEIKDDGSFEVKFPYSNPQIVFTRAPFPPKMVFLEPGKTTFQIIDIGNQETPVIFTGDCARINNDLLKFKDIRSYDYRKMQKKILGFTPEQYKNWCAGFLQQDTDKLNKIAQEHPISAKARQIAELQIKQRNISNMMEYRMNSISTWRKKNNIPRDQRKIDFEPVSPDSSYYDFLTADLVNDPLAVLTSDYYFFINRLKYLDILRDSKSVSLSTEDIIDELVKSGYKLTADEKMMADRMKEIDSPEVKKLQNEFNKKYGDQRQAFYKKYSSELQKLYKEKRGSVVTTNTIEEYLAKQGAEFTGEEKEYFAASKEYNNNPLIQKRNDIYEEQRDAIRKFHSDHRTFVSDWFTKQRWEARNEKMQSVLGIQPGLANDIMTSQDYCRSIVSQMTPLSDTNLKQVQQQINSPFIANYIALMNENTKAKIEANKLLSGSHVNEVPKTKADNFFDAIVGKYKGKVIYVDFWATWCGPCRSGIERIKPLKDEMKDENVVFVYITNQTSPKGTYENMIPGIKGEHYRVSADEWNYLSSKFNITGIPHYTLVGKDGQVINPHLGFIGNSQLKTLLLKYIND